MSDLDKAALNAAEDYLIAIYTDIHRSTIEENWGYEDADLAKIEYNGDGYLACGIASSRIISHGPDTYGDEEWIIEVTPDINVEIEPERYRVYQSTQGPAHWIVEAD